MDGVLSRLSDSRAVYLEDSFMLYLNRLFDAGLCGTSFPDGVALPFQEGPEHPSQVTFVVDDEDVHKRLSRGGMGCGAAMEARREAPPEIRRRHQGCFGRGPGLDARRWSVEPL